MASDFPWAHVGLHGGEGGDKDMNKTRRQTGGVNGEMHPENPLPALPCECQKDCVYLSGSYNKIPDGM